MHVPAGAHEFGPHNATLTVKTGRTGAAAKAGHDLVIEVTAWRATLDVADDGAVGLVLEADATSLRVREGTGGMQALGDDDKENIRASIDDDVLKRKNIAFRSTEGHIDEDRMALRGELTIVGTARPLAFELALGPDGSLAGGARLKQTDWGMKPYSTLFGALKVADEVEVAIDARLPHAAQ